MALPPGLAERGAPRIATRTRPKQSSIASAPRAMRLSLHKSRLTIFSYEVAEDFKL